MGDLLRLNYFSYVYSIFCSFGYVISFAFSFVPQPVSKFRLGILIDAFNFSAVVYSGVGSSGVFICSL